MFLPPSNTLSPRNSQENSKVVSKLGLETLKDQKKPGHGFDYFWYQWNDSTPEMLRH